MQDPEKFGNKNTQMELSRSHDHCNLINNTLRQKDKRNKSRAITEFLLFVWNERLGILRDRPSSEMCSLSAGRPDDFVNKKSPEM
jgi:hypothetical protein